MGLTNAYVLGYGKIPDLFDKIGKGQAPELFTHQLLKDLGFTSSNDRQLLQLLKALGFLSPDGKPTSRYRSYRDHSRSSSVMAEALREAYADIFLIAANPTKEDKKKIQGKFKSFHNASDRVAQLMTSTFYSLLPLADLSPVTTEHVPNEDRALDMTVDRPNLQVPQATLAERASPPGLHYNIQIHLPPTKDVEVYNAIFRSLKEHLFGV